MNEVLNAIKNRRSIRKYSDKQVSRESLDLIIEAGIYAPTALNEQPWHFTVIRNRELIDNISKKTKEVMAKSDVQWIRGCGLNPDLHLSYHAPALIIVSGRKDGSTWASDCVAAIENMLLAAESLGIASVWIGLISLYFQTEGEAAKLGIPEGYEPYYGIAMGYKADIDPLPAPPKNYNVVNYID